MKLFRTAPILPVALAIVTAALLASATPAAKSAPLDGPTTPILDDFNGRGNEDPLYQWGNWAPASVDGVGPTMEIMGSIVGENDVSSGFADSYRPFEIQGDAEVYATVAGIPGETQSSYLYLHLNEAGGPAHSGYRMRWRKLPIADNIWIQRFDAGVVTNLVEVRLDPVVGDALLLRRTGNALEIWRRNAGTWALIASASDSTYQSGMIGLGVDDDNGRWDDFGGTGTVTPPPAQPQTPATGILDNFDRPNEDPLSQGGNWAPGSIDGAGAALEVISQRAGRDGSSQVADSYRPPDLVGDAEVYATVGALPGETLSSYLYLHLSGVGGSSYSGYRLRWRKLPPPDNLWIQRIDAGVVTSLVEANVDPAVGDTLLLRRIGNQIQLWRRSAGSWAQIASTTDSTYQSGKIALGVEDANGRWDDFGGGTFGGPPPGGSGGQSTGTFCARGSLALTATCTLSDPVNTLTGAFVTQVEDLATPGTGASFAWTRSYTSSDTTVGGLGPGWTHTYAASLAVQPNGDVIARGEEGQQLYFTKQGDGSFVGAPGSLASLSLVGGVYKLVRNDQVTYTFTAQGVLTSMKDRNDQGLTLAYDGQARLATITDAAGTQTTVSYNASNLVSQVSTQDGRSVSYGYTSGRLTSVTDVRGKVWAYNYDAGGRLATIVDPLSHTQVTNVYGGDGRVQSQTDAVGKTTTFAWDQATQIATATDANSKVWKHDYDADVLSKEIDPLNNVTQLGHDADLNTSSVTGPTSETTSMSYDANGNILQATAPTSLGSVQKTFVYNAKNDPTQITDARSKVTSYTYTPAGNTQTVTQDGTQVGSYTYDAAGRVLTFTDGNSKTTTYTYDASGNVASVTDPLGNKTTYTYDGAGRVLTRVDPKGNVAGCGCASQFTWTYTYNPAGQVLTETDPLDKVTTHTYDDAGNGVTVTDANGKTTTYAYDNANRLLSITAPDTGVTSYTYDNVGNRLTETDPLNHTTTNTYDSANRLASSTTASGAKTTFFYDPNGNLSKQVEPRGNVGGGVNPDDYATTFTYDAAGRLLTETDPLGNGTTHTYDAVGNELTLKNPNNKTTTSTYDGLNRLSTVTAPDTGVSTFTYDPAGNKLTEKDPRNNVTTFTYDDANRLSSVTKPAGGTTTYGYDPNGNQTSMVEPRGNVAGCGCAAQYTWTYAFDRANRKLSETSPLGHTTSFAYDGVGNQLSAADANTHATSYSYDAVNRLKTVTAPDLGVTTYTYDLAGNLTERKDARNNVTTYGYDVDNRRTSVTNPLSKVWTMTYDPAGNVQQTVDANGNETPAPGDGQTTYTYDRTGRLIGIDYSDATPDVTFTYDAAGNGLSMVDGSGTETRTYDPVNRLLSVTRGTDTFSYAYDLAGNLTQRTYPGSVATSYTYDADNRLATAADGSLTTTYAYDPAGNLTLTTLPSENGHSETRVYDTSGRLFEVKNVRAPSTIRSRFVSTLDPVGNPTRIDRTGALVQTQTYSYDASDRILTVCFAANCTPNSPDRIAWTYDLVGNRVTETRSTGTTSYTYNAGDQMLTAGSTSYSYDSNGNQLSAGSQPFTYDLANRLKTTTQGATTTTYTYDGEGKRLQASTGTAASAKTNFLWDVSHVLPQVALERNGNNVLQRQYIYGLKRIRQTQGTGTYYLYDGVGSVVNTTAPLGALQKTLSYEPYGQIRTTSGSSPTNFWHFTGEYLDPTGLYHLRARQYDPATGRFLGLDPAASQSVATSAYAYALQRPTVFSDPSGRVFRPIDTGTTAAIGAASPERVGPNVPSPEHRWLSSAGWNPFDIHKARHNMALLATVAAVWTKYGTQGISVEWLNPIPGSGPKGGIGYPDIIKRIPGARTLIWEVKPNTESGRAAGRAKMQRYRLGLPGAEPGTKLPDRFGVPVSPTEILSVRSGDIVLGTEGLELYSPFSLGNRPAIRPVPVPLAPPRFEIDWRRGLQGGALATAAVAAAILVPEAVVAGTAGRVIVYRVASLFA